ncbi:uncharacterized protein [Apostichopus japonicus]|uniref:uncharacterized protein isoform X1 n=1 Tax=Stichopus japonicus TaxID=307972 RepID=UPI003AB6B2CE
MNISAQSASSTHSTGTARKPAKTIKLKTFLNSKAPHSSPSQRKSLQQLQPSAGDDSKLVGKDGFVRSVNQKPRTPKRKRDGDGEKPAKRHAKFIAKPSKKFSVYKDITAEGSKSSGETVAQKTKKTPEEEAYELMVQEEIPEKYWEDIAEERRVALENTLNENERLHTEVNDLKEENQRLKVTADQAVYLAEVVQDLLGEKEEEEDGEKEDEDEIKCEERLKEDEGDAVNTEEDGNDRKLNQNCTREESSEEETESNSRSEDDEENVESESESNDCR